MQTSFKHVTASLMSWLTKVTVESNLKSAPAVTLLNPNRKSLTVSSLTLTLTGHPSQSVLILHFY